MFEYWAVCTLGQVPFEVDDDDHCHEKIFLMINSQMMLIGRNRGI
jgi:hypothetical protein